MLTHSISCVLQACVGYMNVHNDTSVLEHMFMTVCVCLTSMCKEQTALFFFFFLLISLFIINFRDLPPANTHMQRRGGA